MITHQDYIRPQDAQTLFGLLETRVARCPAAIAYRYFDSAREVWTQLTWQEFFALVTQFRAALAAEQLQSHERVGIMLKNSPQWLAFDQASQSLGLVNVPFYMNDRSENAAYIIRDANVKLLVVQNLRMWKTLAQVSDIVSHLKRVICVDKTTEEARTKENKLFCFLSDWLPQVNAPSVISQPPAIDPNALATIVYTSGTTGRPKGVMLSHKNILTNAYAALQCGEFVAQDVFLSILPLSHALERTGGYYLPMMAGATVCYARSVQQLVDDLITIKPTVFICVPRIYETIYTRVMAGLKDQSPSKQHLFNLTLKTGWKVFQNKQKQMMWHPLLLLWPMLNYLVAKKISSRFGGRLKYAISGGAPLRKEVAQFFVSIGVPLYQGYGLTECSPTISVGRPAANNPFSIGKPIPHIEVKILDSGELVTRGECVMLGYHNHANATRAMINEHGWLHTGDQAQVDENGFLYITGRIKDIIVLANAEKVAPETMEAAICAHPLFLQSMVIGEGQPFLSAVIVIDESQWQRIAQVHSVYPDLKQITHDTKTQHALLKILGECVKEFPGYAQIRKAVISIEPWTIENGLLTPTLKIKRREVTARFAQEINAIYQMQSDCKVYLKH